MVRYIVMKSPASGEIIGVFDREKEFVIPLSESNTDYRAYLDWVADGNEPDIPEVE